MRELFFMFIAIASVVVLGVMAGDYADCKEAGGVLVRGLFWFECVGGKP